MRAMYQRSLVSAGQRRKWSSMRATQVTWRRCGVGRAGSASSSGGDVAGSIPRGIGITGGWRGGKGGCGWPVARGSGGAPSVFDDGAGSLRTASRGVGGCARSATSIVAAAGWRGVTSLSAGTPSKPGRLRLDELTIERYPEHSRTVVQSWIAQGKVLVDGQPVVRPA